MKVSSIGVTSTPQFSGEKTKKAMRNTAGAAAIALATAMPMENADAQYMMPPPPIPPITYYQNYLPQTAFDVPDCFVYGDVRNFDYDKSLKQTFDDIDSQGRKNGFISVNEAIAADRENWNATHLYPYNSYQLNRTVSTFNLVSTMYNEEGSNPKTINFREYAKIMKDYMQARNINTFFNLLRIITVPRIVCPPPPPHHHHHPAPPPPPHRHRY
ncbi:TPA: hypothetical protein IAC10_14575 [Candidatus Scatousia excrementigallinarum]|uniref:Uncharacterized protein n=1 Tax=Candidatus Scatousia excrementigallinarum TaxID=2840935 RepID=A0A9D1F1M8_9BACT|nr:hypothetical protein [Candidatus Scatousia excrementigallinarum]